jgi:fructuronate reductase
LKLRLLNGTHSSLAYLGYLAGYETVADTMEDAAFATFGRQQMDQVTPTLIVPAGVDVEAHKAALCERFRNPSLRHRTWQIAMDGSQKLPQRLLYPIRDLLARGAPIDRPALGVAGWMRYVTGIDEKGRPIDVRDPLAARLRSAADAAGPVAERLAPALIAMEEVFGRDLAGDPRFTEAVTKWLGRLYAVGARRTVEEAVAA